MGIALTALLSVREIKNKNLKETLFFYLSTLLSCECTSVTDKSRCLACNKWLFLDCVSDHLRHVCVTHMNEHRFSSNFRAKVTTQEIKIC